MGIFSPSKKETDADTPVASSGNGDDSGLVEIAKAREDLARAGKKSSRKPKPTQDDETKKQAELVKLFSPEQWEEIVSLYPDIRYAMTGYENFRLSMKEKAVLSTSMSTMMSYLIAIDPKYLAIALFTANFAGIIGRKEIEYAQSQKREKGDGGKKGS